MAQSSFLSRWTGRPEAGETASPDSEQPSHDVFAPEASRSQLSVWSISPSLERIRQELDEQAGIIAEAKRLLEERLTPFQRHLVEQRRHVEQCLKQLDARLTPLRRFLDGQASNLERVGMHLNGELKEQFEGFEGFLAEQRKTLARANQYLDEQPLPLDRYLEDEQRAIEQIFRDLEERFEPLGRYLRRQRLLAIMTEPPVIEDSAYWRLLRGTSRRAGAFRRCHRVSPAGSVRGTGRNLSEVYGAGWRQEQAPGAPVGANPASGSPPSGIFEATASRAKRS
jgi:hypothetical protein